MTTKTPAKKRARAIQALTGWSYTEALRVANTLTLAAFEALAAMRQTSLDKTAEAWAKLVKSYGGADISWIVEGSSVTRRVTLLAPLPQDNADTTRRRNTR